MQELTPEERQLLLGMPEQSVVLWLGRFQWHPEYIGQRAIHVRRDLIMQCIENQAEFEGAGKQSEHLFAREDAFWGPFIGSNWDQMDLHFGTSLDRRTGRWQTIDPETVALRMVRYAVACDNQGVMLPVEEYTVDVLDIQRRSKLSRLSRAIRKNTGAGWKKSGETLQRRDQREREARIDARTFGLIR